jgi:squalene-hopene/tetraprenyl-beta-curcumene cyclase
MHTARLVLALIALAPLGAASCRAEASAPETTAQGASLKDEVDALIHKIRGVESGKPIEPKSALEAAVMLAALANCHRAYTLEDGPVVKPYLSRLFAARRADGLFGEGEAARATTAWTCQALGDLDAQHYAADLNEIRKSFGRAYSLEGEAREAALRPLAGDLEPLRAVVQADYLSLIEKVAAAGRAKAKPVSRPEPTFEPFQQQGVDYLMAQQKDGTWLVPGPQGQMVPDPGITALALAGIASKPAKLRSERENETLQKGVAFLLAAQQQNENGSFSSYLPNYITCAAVLGLARAGGDLPGVKEAMAKAQSYLVGIQNVERVGYASGDRDYGSIGYGGDQRGDLSNTQFALEALSATGLDKNDEVWAKALVYLRRCQNLPGKDGWHGTRTTEDGRKVKVVPGSDGGAQYYPGNSFAGYDETSDGSSVPRSYGSMTYALLKCYALAGLPKGDPRLQAALNWCLSNFTLDENPGANPELGEKAKYQGLYYYYLTLARALALAEVKDVKGRDWRAELRAKLKSLQKDDGSWVNDKNDRWWENSKVLCTAYALLALSE